MAEGYREFVVWADPGDEAGATDIPAAKDRRARHRKLFAIGGAAKELPNVFQVATHSGRAVASRILSTAGFVVVGLLLACPRSGPAQTVALHPADTEPAERALLALRRAWFDEIEELTAITRTLAVADDTYEFVARPNLPYVYDHYDRKRLAADRIDTVLIVDRNRKPLFWRRVNNRNNRGFPDAEAFLAELPALAPPGTAGVQSLAGAARLAHGPSLVVVLPIYPANGSGEPRGWLITSRALDDVERHVYEERAHVSVDLFDPAASGLPAGVEAALKTPLEPVTRIETTQVRGFMSVPDLSGQPFRILSVLLPRPIAAAPPATVSPLRHGLWLALAALIAGIACVIAARSVDLRRRRRVAARASAGVPPRAASVPGPTSLRTADAPAPVTEPPVTIVAPEEPDDGQESELDVTIDFRPSPSLATPPNIADAPAAVVTLPPANPPVAEARAPNPPCQVTDVAPTESDRSQETEVEVTPNSRPSPPAAAPADFAEAPVAAVALAPADLTVAVARTPETPRQVTEVAPTEPDRSHESEVEVTLDFRPTEQTATLADIAEAPAAARDWLHARLAQTRAVVRYQPQVNLRTGRVAGVEALLCITNSGADEPATKLVAEFEAAGLGIELAEWWLQEACSARRYWRRQTGDDFPVSVPVSPIALEEPAFPARVRRLLADKELSAQYLELEVPEAVLGGNAAARRALAEVQEAGVLVAIDRFDGSRSSLRSLTLMPIAKIRVHPNLVRKAGAGAPEVVLLDGIIGAARGLGTIVCATGVDSPDLAAAVELHGCSLAQGTALGPLVDGDQFLALVRGAEVDTATLRPLQLDQDAPRGLISSFWSRVAGGRRT